MAAQPSPRQRVKRRVVRRRDPFAAFPAPLRAWAGETLAPAWRTISAPPVLLLLLLALPALLLAYQFQATHRIDVGEGDDGFYMRGTFAQEQGGGTDFRWLSDNSEVVVPGAPGNSTWTATLRLSGARPTGAATPMIRVLADGREVARFNTVGPFNDYTFQFRRPPLANEDLRLTIESQTFDPPGDVDNRQLGVALDSVMLLPERDRAAAPFLYPPAYAICALALLALLAGLLGYLGTPVLGVAAAIVAALIAISAGQIREPDITAQYLFSLLLILAATVAVTVALRPLVRRLFARGGVALSAREERWLGGIFAFGALAHLAGVFYPGFAAHDLVFQAHRVEDILRGNFLLSAVSSEWGYQRTPYPPRCTSWSLPLLP